MKIILILQIILSAISVQSFAAKFMMVAPQESSLEIPSQALIWKGKVNSEKRSRGFLICEDEARPRIRFSEGVIEFSDTESCEKVQMMLRLASPQCPLQLNVNNKSQKINSFRLECDKLKI